MQVTEYTKGALKVRREAKKLSADGYQKAEVCWKILRGSDHDKVITDVKISACGKYVWYKIGGRP